VGKIIYQAAAKNLTPVTLELGGKSPAIVSAHCNLSMTVKRLVWAKFLNAGQTCIAPDYVMVHHSMYSKFVEACKREIEKADYTISNGNYCQIINTSHFDRLSTYIKEGTLLYGGQMNENERMIAPTLLELNSWEATFMQDEIFGPILPIGTYDSLPKVLQQIKEYPKPLSAYLFSENKKEQKIFLKDFQFGGGAINDAVMHITNPNLPFGGVGTSGMGNYHGKAGFDCFSHHKSILRKPTWMELPLKYAPLKPIKLSLIRKLLKL